VIRFDNRDLDQLAGDFERNVRIARLRKKYRLSSRGLLQTLVEARRLGAIRKNSFARLLLKRVSYHFPQDPEARFKTALSCLDTELKQAVLLEVELYPRTYFEIGKRLVENTNVRLPAIQSLSSYLVDTLVPAGLVIEERLGRGFGLVRRYFGLSREGEKYGQPLAAFSLKYAVDHNISLYELLGQALTRGASASPYHRIRIVELVSQGHSRMIDLMDALGLVIEDVRQHLDKLTKLGILKYESLDFGRGGTNVYSWVRGRLPQDAKTVRELKKLTGKVAQWLYRHEQGDRNQIAHAIGHKHPTNISQVLAGLVEQGLAQTPFASYDKSRISLLPGSRVVTDYARSARMALKGGSALKNMNDILEELRNDRKMLCRYLDAGVELYRAVSPELNARTRLEREAGLLEFIRRYTTAEGRGPRPVDVAKGLGWTHGIVTLYLRTLISKNLLSREKKGPAARYIER
jgi:predicted transcriptional regulator